MRHVCCSPCLIALTAVCTLWLGVLTAQDEPQPPGRPPAADGQEAAPEPEDSDSPPDSPAAQASPESIAAYKAFDEKMQLWKETIKNLRLLKTKYQAASEEDLPPLKQAWDQLIARGEALIPELREAAKAYYLAEPQDPEATLFLVKLMQDYVERDDYEPALDLSHVLIDNNCPFDQIYKYAGLAAFATDDFEVAETYLKEADRRGVLDAKTERDHLESVASYRELWKKEQEIRQREAAADDLPRVRLKTTKGDIVVELFENEAPATVGNFVSLVKSKFYDGLTFHRVLQGFMAQVGCPLGDGTGDPGYHIKCECFQDNARMHFRGSLSMAKGEQPDSGGSQFFLTFVPTPHLNPDSALKTGHTVFGRVIEGLDVLAKLQRRDPDPRIKGPKPEPDRILQAEVIRDRGHEYAPDKVQ